MVGAHKQVSEIYPVRAYNPSTLLWLSNNLNPDYYNIKKKTFIIHPQRIETLYAVLQKLQSSAT